MDPEKAHAWTINRGDNADHFVIARREARLKLSIDNDLV